MASGQLRANKSCNRWLQVAHTSFIETCDNELGIISVQNSFLPLVFSCLRLFYLFIYLVSLMTECNNTAVHDYIFCFLVTEFKIVLLHVEIPPERLAAVLLIKSK